MKKTRNNNNGEDKKVHVKLRQNQMFGPWGPGAVIPCPDGSSLMIAGLDAFPPVNQMERVYDRRLARYVGVSKLLAPPLDKAMIPAVRFPHWMYCPHCKTMKLVKNTQQANPRCDSPKCEKKPYLIPDRFIVACPEGHVDDLPILEWVHQGPVSDPSAHTIIRITTGERSSLGDVVYKCTTCGVSRSLAHITRKGEFFKTGYRCRGSQPWLDIPNGQCHCHPDEVVVIQRGGTNVWYSDVASSIYVPEVQNKELFDFIERHIEKLNKYNERGDDRLREYVEDSLVDRTTYTAEEIISAYREYNGNVSAGRTQTEMDFRKIEYDVIREVPPSALQKGVFSAKVVETDSYSSSFLKEVVSSISLVSTLKETKALVGFTRLFPQGDETKSMPDRRKILSRNSLDWTLGIQMTGEGIFFSSNKAALENWTKNNAASNRFATMQRNFDRANSEQEKDTKAINPLYVFIHTLSHILMLELGKECGYSAASVKERIYCDRFITEDNRHDTMLGLLIYTASDDSEGSLGGLVRAGKPGRLEKVFDNALYSACWCSSDPVCIESPGQGQSSCNLAACFSCALVPETSCEIGNKFLDRALLVGTLESPECGFFGEVLRCSRDDLLSEETDELRIDLESGRDVGQSSFRDACEFALFDATDSERKFIKELIELSENEDFEVPIPDVEFLDKDGNAAAASLVWMNRHVVLLLSEQLEEFEDAFGFACPQSTIWQFIAFGKEMDVRSFAKLIRR